MAVEITRAPVCLVLGPWCFSKTRFEMQGACALAVEITRSGLEMTGRGKKRM